MSGQARTVGVLGGMGPAATIDFMAKVLAASQARREQDGVRLIVDSNPAVPDRNEAIAGRGPSPGPVLAAMARGLAGAGADFLVMACNAAHAFEADVRAATPLPFVSIIEETCKVALERRPGLRTAGVLAAAGALDARLYETAFARFGVEAITPQDDSRRRFMDMLYRIKAGDVGPTVRAGVRLCAEELIGRGSEVIVAGCTEVPLVLAPADLDRPFIDSTESLAARVVAYARGEPLPR